MFNFFKNSKKTLVPLDEIFFDESNAKSFYDKYFSRRIPVLIKGGAKDWPLISKWNKEYIIKKSGNYPCTIVSDSRPAMAQKRATLKKYFSSYKNNSTLTLQKYNPASLPYFFRDIPVPNSFFANENIARYFFFHSVKDAGTLPHKHRDAFNILQSGKKQWIFHDANPRTSPKGFQKMNSFHQSYASGSHVKDWFEKELPSLPKDLKKTIVYQCYQEAGDIVYIPVDFSHTVLNHSEVMGLVIERNR